MSMVEVCYELNGLVDYLVSSESYSPTAGWPYRQILEKIDAELQKNKQASTEELATIIVGEYIGFYNDYIVGGLSVDQSVLEVSASEGVVGAVKNFAKDIEERLKTNEPFKDALILAHWEAQSYNGELFVDLLDFCERLAARIPGGKGGIRPGNGRDTQVGPEVVLHRRREPVLQRGVDLLSVGRCRAVVRAAGVRSRKRVGIASCRRTYRRRAGSREDSRTAANCYWISQAPDHSSSSQLSWAVNDSERRANVKPANEAPSIPSTVCATRQSPW